MKASRFATISKKVGQRVPEATVQLGDVVTAALPSRDPRGHEQEGLRPAVVVGLPDRLGPGRFDILVLVPFTSYLAQPWVDAAPERYPRFDPGTAGLRSESVALLDQVTAVDVSRLRRRRGQLSAVQYRTVRAGLELMFGDRKVVLG